MEFSIDKVTGIGEFDGEDTASGMSYLVPNGKVFCLVRPNTIEVRTDANLKKVLMEKYETVMESRYFGRGGIEIVPSGQIGEEEIYDLVRLSYNLSLEG
ncbi:MmcQ/YjbR family DNA-binding protein [Candidatus Saccharibacteria bacterium]|nr:MmcQ/YjbR family DNA-binding protein [Candidatus Saccharibacteria bacterium]